MNQQKNSSYASFIHFSQFAGYIIPFLGMILPIILWQNKKEDPYVDAHGKIVINWIITQIVYLILGIALTFLGVGILILVILGLISIIFTIIGGIKALNGEIWKYPMSIVFFENTNEQDLNKQQIISSSIELFSVGRVFSPTIIINNSKVLTLGKSSSCDITISNKYLSAKHIEISMSNNRVYIKDTNSTNGTYIDGVKLISNKKTELKNNEKLIIGSEEIIYEIV